MAVTAVSIKLNTVKLDEISKQLSRRASKILDLAAARIEKGAKRRARVDTGALKNSIGWRREGQYTRIIGDGVEYGIDVEFGTKAHEIRAKGKVLAFSPVVGHKLNGKALYRKTTYALTTSKKGATSKKAAAYQIGKIAKKGEQKGQYVKLRKPKALYRHERQRLVQKAGSNTMIFVKSVRHPGTKPYPFLRPAVEAERGALETAWRQLFL